MWPPRRWAAAPMLRPVAHPRTWCWILSVVVTPTRRAAADVREFARAERSTPDGRGWGELTRAEQRKIIDSHRLVYQSEAPVTRR